MIKKLKGAIIHAAERAGYSILRTEALERERGEREFAGKLQAIAEERDGLVAERDKLTKGRIIIEERVRALEQGRLHSKSVKAGKNSTLKFLATRLLPASLVWRRELEELRTEQHRREDALSDERQALRTALVSAREDAARRESEVERELVSAREDAARRGAEFEQRLTAAAAELAAARDAFARREAELQQRFNSQLAESIKVIAAVTADREKPARRGQSPKRRYREYGFHVFRGLFPISGIARIHEMLEAEVYRSDAPLLRHPQGQRLTNVFSDTVNAGKVVANALWEPHLQPEMPGLAQALIDLICTDAVAQRLAQLDGKRRYLLCQTILFFLSPTTQLHIDGWAFDTEPSGGAHTIWFPLEEIIFDQGPVCVAEWKLGNVLSASDMGIEDFPGELARDGLGTYKRYHDGLNCEIERRAVTLHVPQLRLGDAVVFASLTPHGSVPARGNQKFRRMAVQAIVAPAGEPLGNLWRNLSGERPTVPEASEIRPINDRWGLRLRAPA